MTLPGGQLTMTHDLIPVTGLHGLTLIPETAQIHPDYFSR